MATGAVDRYHGRAKRWPIWRDAAGVLHGEYVLLSAYATAGDPLTDPGAGTKTANSAGLLAAVTAAQNARHNTILVDGTYWTNSAPLYVPGPIRLVGRNRSIDSAYTGAQKDGFIGDNDATGTGASVPKVGIVFALNSSGARADGCEAYGLRFELKGATGRGDGSHGQHGIEFLGGHDVVLQDCQTVGAGASGVYFPSCNRAFARGNVISACLADGYRSAESNDVMIEHNRLDSCGDDMLAFVANVNSSPDGAGGGTYRYNYCKNGATAGGAIHVDGGSNLIFDGNICHNYFARGLQFECSSAYNAIAIDDVLAQNNTLSKNQTATNSEGILCAGRTTYFCTNVTITGNVCSGQMGKHIRTGANNHTADLTANIVITNHRSLALAPATGNLGASFDNTTNLTFTDSTLVGVSDHGVTADKASGANTGAGTWTFDNLVFDTLNPGAAANRRAFNLSDFASGSIILISNTDVISTYAVSWHQWFLFTNFAGSAACNLNASTCTTAAAGGVTNTGTTNWVIN